MRTAQPTVLEFTIGKANFKTKPFYLHEIVGQAIGEMPELLNHFYTIKRNNKGDITDVVVDRNECWDNDYFVERCWKIISRQASAGVKIKPEYFTYDKQKLMAQKFHQMWNCYFTKDTQSSLATHKIKYKQVNNNKTLFLKCKLSDRTPKFIADTIQLRETKIIQARVKKNVQRSNDRHLMLGENFRPLAIDEGVKYLKAVQPIINEKEQELNGGEL